MPEERMMPQYQSHKKVWALEIATVYNHDLTFKDDGFAPITCPDEMFARYQPLPGDYLVQYEDGYKSFSPRKAFLEGYVPI